MRLVIKLASNFQTVELEIDTQDPLHDMQIEEAVKIVNRLGSEVENSDKRKSNKGKASESPDEVKTVKKKDGAKVEMITDRQIELCKKFWPGSKFYYSWTKEEARKKIGQRKKEMEGENR